MPITKGTASESLWGGRWQGDGSDWHCSKKVDSRKESLQRWGTHVADLELEGQVRWELMVVLNGHVSVVYGKHL